jgi:hypothetical protein
MTHFLAWPTVTAVTLPLEHCVPIQYMSYCELLVRWAWSDATATAYELTYLSSSKPELVFLAQQMRLCAATWDRLLELEERHMQQRMPRVREPQRRLP